MPLQPVHVPQPLLLAPPLVLRSENGSFGAKRPAVGAFANCEPCNRFEEPPAGGSSRSSAAPTGSAATAPSTTTRSAPA